MFAQHYEVPCNQHPRSPSLMQFVLDKYKTLRPDLFREDLRISPPTFDKIVDRISSPPVFSNNSNNPQSPVEDQLAITLFCFSHYSNAASLERVRKWAGTSKGLVKLATCWVMTALLSPDFMKHAVQLTTSRWGEGRHKDLGRGTFMQSLAQWLVSHWWHSYPPICLAILVWRKLLWSEVQLLPQHSGESLVPRTCWSGCSNHFIDHVVAKSLYYRL